MTSGRSTRGTLAGAVGGLPAPPKIGKPPAPRVARALGAIPARAMLVRPQPPRSLNALHITGKFGSVAGRLGSIRLRDPR